MIYENIKRIYQSIDLRFNKLINAKTETPTKDSHPQLIANKEYVDQQMLFRSKLDPSSPYNRPESNTTVTEVLDKVQHSVLSATKHFQAPTFQLFCNIKEYREPARTLFGKSPILFKGIEYLIECMIDVNYNDYVLSESEDVVSLKTVGIIGGGATLETPINNSTIQWLSSTDFIKFKYVRRILGNEGLPWPRLSVTFKKTKTGIIKPITVYQDFRNEFENLIKYSVVDCIWLSLSKEGTDVQKLQANYNKTQIINLPRQTPDDWKSQRYVVDIAVPRSLIEKHNLVYSGYNSSTSDVKLLEYQTIELNSSNLIIPETEIKFDDVSMAFCRLDLGYFENGIAVEFQATPKY